MYYRVPVHVYFVVYVYLYCDFLSFFFFFFQAEDGIRDLYVTGVQTCALPISNRERARQTVEAATARIRSGRSFGVRSGEHTSELQSRRDLVCRLLLEKKKETNKK